MSSIIYSGTALNAKFAPVETGYTRTAAATNIKQGGVDINTLYAGYDNRAGNQSTATGVIKANGTDIATLFNKINPAIGVTATFGLPSQFISYNFYSGRLIGFSVSGTGPLKIDYSDTENGSPFTPVTTFTNPTVTFNTFAYQAGNTYTYTITTSGVGVPGGYVTVTSSFTPNP